jgi:hypothetical protein
MYKYLCLTLLSGVLMGCTSSKSHGPVIREEQIDTRKWTDVWGKQYSAEVIEVTYSDGTTRKFIK